jgi:hypothetical protein
LSAAVSSLVTKVQCEGFAHSQGATVKAIVVCGIDYLACQGKFLVDKPLYVKENDEHALTILGLSEFGVFH